MAGIIRLNQDGLTQSSSQLKQGSSELELLIQNLQKIVDTLPEYWEGDAAEAYRDQFARLRPGLDETRQLVEDIALQIDQTLAAAQELDSSIASKLR